jgi:hypothetical protein
MQQGNYLSLRRLGTLRWSQAPARFQHVSRPARHRRMTEPVRDTGPPAVRPNPIRHRDERDEEITTQGNRVKLGSPRLLEG